MNKHEMSANDVTATRMNTTMEFTLLSAQLTGAAEKNENGVEFLVMPEEQNSETDELPFENFVDEINGLFGKMTSNDDYKLDASSIFEKIKEFISGITLSALKVRIKQVFIHLVKPKDGKAWLEFAFSIGVDISENKTSETTYVQLRSVTFGIWNTDNKKVIEKMGLLDIAQLLG